MGHAGTPRDASRQPQTCWDRRRVHDSHAFVSQGSPQTIRQSALHLFFWLFSLLLRFASWPLRQPVIRRAAWDVPSSPEEAEVAFGPRGLYFRSSHLLCASGGALACCPGMLASRSSHKANTIAIEPANIVAIDCPINSHHAVRPSRETLPVDADIVCLPAYIAGSQPGARPQQLSCRMQHTLSQPRLVNGWLAFIHPDPHAEGSAGTDQGPSSPRAGNVAIRNGILHVAASYVFVLFSDDLCSLFGHYTRRQHQHLLCYCVPCVTPACPS